MSIKITSSKAAKHQGVNVLVYGRPGVGKTVLCATAPKPIIISAERGLLSIADDNIPVIQIKNFKQFKSAYKFLKKSENRSKYSTICVDSITDIAVALLRELKKEEKDPRQAYGKMADRVIKILGDLLSIPKMNIYVTAKVSKSKEDDDGEALFQPSLPGNMLPESLPYMFDEYLALRISRTDEEEEDSEGFRYLQTQPSYRWDAKDRSGKLNEMERPHLGKLFKKITK